MICSTFFARLTHSYHRLLVSLSRSPLPPSLLAPLSLPLALLTPFFTPAGHTADSVSFWPALLSQLLPALLPPSKFPTPADELLQRARLRGMWNGVWDELDPGGVEKGLRTLAQELERTLLANIGGEEADDEDGEARKRSRVAERAAAWILEAVFGQPSSPAPPPSNAHATTPADEDDADARGEALWAATKSVFLDTRRSWSESMARVVVRWVAGEPEGRRERWLGEVMAGWAEEGAVKRGTVAGRTCTSPEFSLLLMAL